MKTEVIEATKPVSQANVISSAANTLRAFRFIADSHRPINATDIAEYIGVSHPTAFRIAQTLVSEGFIEFDRATRTYQVSMGLVAAVWSVIDRIEVRDIVRPAIQQTVREFGETITFGIPGEGSIVFVDRVEGTANVRFFCNIGRRLPLHAGAAAKSILAHLPDEEFEAYVAQPLASLTPATKTEPEELRVERAKILAQGYATSIDEVDVGVSAVGVPILNHNNEVIAAAAIANLTARWDESDLAFRAKRMMELAETLNSKCSHLVPKRAAS